MRSIAISTLLFFLTISHAETLTIGIQAYAPPYSLFAGKNRYFGFEVALMDAICKEINAQCQYSPGSYDQLLAKVREGKLDLALATIPINNENQTKYLFSLPYLNSYGQLITLINSPIHSIADTKGKRFGTWKDELFLRMIREKFSEHGEIKQYTKFSELIHALVNGKVDVVLLRASAAKYRASSESSVDYFKLVGDKISLGNCYGIITRPENLALIERLNYALLKLENNGVYMQIYTKYFGK